MSTAVSSPPTTSSTDTLRVVPGDRHSEVAATLVEPVPQPLGLLDQLGLWGNLGVSLLGFTGAIYVLQPFGDGPYLAPVAAAVAIVAGTVLGGLILALSAVPGAQTGAPAMMLLRGLFGARLSALPTVMNVLQCLGWGTFEIVTIATAGHRVMPWAPRWTLVLVAGALTMALTVRPLGAIRLLRRYVTGAVVIVLAYLLIQLLRHPLPPLTHGTWSGFWVAMDSVVAVSVSFVPLAADYTRHARSSSVAFVGPLVGYGITQILCYGLGMLALLTVAKTPDDIYGAFIAVPLGTVAFAVLATRELDQSFANVYSTAVSIQNLRPLWDRRVLAAAISVITTTLALAIGIRGYQNFLLLLGAVFVPLAGVLIVDWFVVSRGRWSLADDAPARPWLLLPWVLGFVMYQLVNPGEIGWWVRMWGHVDSALHFTDPSWLSASLSSFLVAAVLTGVVGLFTRPQGARPSRR